MFLLDTNVVSALRRVERLDPKVAERLIGLSRDEAFVSVVKLMEIEFGVLAMEQRDPTPGRILREWFIERQRVLADDRVLPITETVAPRCAALGIPDPRPLLDALIAATALVHELTVVTRNVADFAGIEGLRLFDPWA